MLARIAAAVKAAAANSEVRHDVGLFVAALVATGVFDRGAPLTLGALGSAVTVAVRRVVRQRIKAVRRKSATG